MYVPAEGSDPQTTDDYTTLIQQVANANGGSVHEQKSKAKELAAVSGMVLVQPYLDFDYEQAQGEIKIKIWEYNAFLVDPYFRNPDMSDAQFVWCQEYISKKEAENRFPGKLEQIAPMAGTPQRYGSFYFLPENYNMARNDLMVLSYVWYKWKRKKKRLYSRSRNQFFDIKPNTEVDAILYNIPDMEEVTVEVPTWKLAVVLNDQLMYQGDNPLGFDECPFVAYYWNYEPHQTYYDLRVRSLIKTMRDAQFLYNYKVIVNNDIASATINAGWKRKIGAVANEDVLKKSGQGWDVIINEGYELTDCEKIVPSAVPESDLYLAEQMKQLMFDTSGFNLENWAAQQDKQASSLTVMLKQAANLMIFQKYFDQWDLSDKLLGNLLLKVALNNWNAEKVKLYIGRDPSPFFYSGIFSKFQCNVEECDLTPTQQNLQAQQMMDINMSFQREVFPPSMIIPKLNITGKAQVIQFLQQQEQAAQAQQQEAAGLQHAFQNAQLQELISRATANIAAAKERMGRSESNLGLFEERLSQITQNRSASLKNKMEALAKLIEVVEKYGQIEAALQMNNLDTVDLMQQGDEEQEKRDSRQTALANEFMAKILSGGMKQLPGGNQQMQQQQQMPQMAMQ